MYWISLSSNITIICYEIYLIYNGTNFVKLFQVSIYILNEEGGGAALSFVADSTCMMLLFNQIQYRMSLMLLLFPVVIILNYLYSLKAGTFRLNGNEIKCQL